MHLPTEALDYISSIKVIFLTVEIGIIFYNSFQEGEKKTRLLVFLCFNNHRFKVQFCLLCIFCEC